MTKDEPFVPTQRTAEQEKADMRPAPQGVLRTVLDCAIMLFIGWPLYLTIHASGTPSKQLISHFDPSAPIFRPADRHLIVLSNIGLIVWTVVVVFLSYTFGVWNIIVC